MKRMIMGMLSLTLSFPAVSLPETRDAWKPLFNGKDLAGWDTWLGKPHESTLFPGLAKDEKGEYSEPVGLNNDPHRNYTVVELDGAPAIRISGEVFGALTTRDEYENYHFRAEFKWGEKKWPPRESQVRDSGLLYHCVGPQGAVGGGSFWMKSFEMQIQEKDCGDFWSVGGVIVDVEAVRQDLGDGKSVLVYKKGASVVPAVASRIIKDPDNEKPSGEWNVVEFFSVGQTSVHVVNGKVNMILRGLRHQVDGKEVPLTRGKIQIQSEGAEIFWRKIEIRPISEIPKQYLD